MPNDSSRPAQHYLVGWTGACGQPLLIKFFADDEAETRRALGAILITDPEDEARLDLYDTYWADLQRSPPKKSKGR